MAQPSSVAASHNPSVVDRLPALAADARSFDDVVSGIIPPRTGSFPLHVHCVNWPYEATEHVPSSGDGDELLINLVFERRFRNPGNWLLGPAFAEAYPSLVDDEDQCFACMMTIQGNVSASALCLYIASFRNGTSLICDTLFIVLASSYYVGR